MDYQEALNVIVTEVKKVVSKGLETALYDRTYSGSVVSQSGTSCQVKINGKNRAIKTSKTYSAGDYVLVHVMQNNWNNAIILGKVKDF